MGVHTGAAITKAVVGRVADGLRVLGFQKRAGATFTLSVTDEVLGFVGLNRATDRSTGAVQFNPVVGVRHEGVERLVAALHGESVAAAVSPTVSLSLGYLMPERRYRRWTFEVAEDVSAGASNLVAAVKNYGIPFIRRHSSVSSVIEAIEADLVPAPDQRAERLAAALWLAGQSAQAMLGVDAYAERLRTRSDPAAERFRRFAEAFRAMVST